MNSTELVLEVSTYVGDSLISILYGADICIYFTSVYLFLKKKTYFRGRTTFYIIYGGVLLLMLTIYVIVNQYFGQLLWIVYRNDPGGPPAWFADNINSWLYVLGSSVAAVANAMGDGLMFHRCYIIWGADIRATIIPFMIYVCTVASSVATIVCSALPNGNIWNGVAGDLDILRVASTASFNMVVSAMICYRIITISRMHRHTMSRESLKTYTGIVSMIVEATIPFTILGPAYLVVQVYHSGSEAALADVWWCFCALSPQLIILRIAMGLAWSKDTMDEVTSHWMVALNPDHGIKSELSA